MGSQAKSSSLYPLEPLKPLTSEDVSYPNYPITTPDDVLQLQTDTANVVEGRVDWSEFSEDYQKKIKNYYRFYGTRSLIGGMGTHSYGKVMRDTLDKV